MVELDKVWADGFGNWHARIRRNGSHRGQMIAYRAIRAELEARSRHGAHLPAFTMIVVSEDDDTITYAESWPDDDCHPDFHAVGVHAPGYIPRHRAEVSA